MYKRKVIVFALAVGIMMVGYSLGYAQSTGPVDGKVELLKPDGSREPVANALIEVYRIDMGTGFPSSKTNKKGEFAFAGLAFGGEYVVSVSAPGITPKIFPGVKAGRSGFVITVVPGDGTKFTEKEVREAVANKSLDGTTTGEVDASQLSEEDKKKKAEYDAKVAEVTAKNEKIKQTDAKIRAALKAGNDAFAAKNYDVAVEKYDEGIQADPDFVGTAPVLLNNKAIALKERGVATYNNNVKNTDKDAKAEAFKKARQDFLDAAEAYAKSLSVIRSAPAEDISDPANTEAAKTAAIRGGKDVIRIAVQVEQIGDGLADYASQIIPEYLKIETDSAKKAEARLIIADLYRVSGKMNEAVTAYKAILEISPDDVDALAGVGLVLVDQGWIEDDKAKSQEGANYLQKFVSIAPDTHKLKTGAAEYLKLLKDQNIIPAKAPAKKRG